MIKKIIVPVLQPIYDLVDDRVSHHEALLRITDDIYQKGHIDLIQLGEKYGFIGHIDIGMVEQVVSCLRKCPRMIITVNVSPVTVNQFSEDMISFVKNHMDIASRLVFEITETSPIHDLDELVTFAWDLRTVGCKIALDDYGNANGCINESVVRRVRPDLLKLDGTVLKAALKGDKLLADSVNLAVKVGAEIVAEFVDSDEKIEFLRASGVRYAQGFAFGVPEKMSRFSDGVVQDF